MMKYHIKKSGTPEAPRHRRIYKGKHSIVICCEDITYKQIKQANGHKVLPVAHKKRFFR